MNKFNGKFVVLSLILAFSINTISYGQVFAFLNDIEENTDIDLQLGILDFSLNSASDFSPEINPSQQIALRTINLSQIGGLGFKYIVEIKNPSGNLCSYLNIKDDIANTYQSLINFESDETSFSANSNITLTANSSSYSEALQGEVCNFDIVFSAWQENLLDNTLGFTDIETINSTIKMAYWNSDVVMNEFLPNANNYPEYIEFYNKGINSIDMNGYYVMANGNRIDINTTTTNTYSGGTTIINPHSWLVATTGGDLLDDSSGTIRLFNFNDVEIDAYTYDARENNINNTPGETNNLIACLPFEDNLLDISGNDNNGTNYGSVFADGRINRAIELDGTNKYVEIADSDSLDITDSITLEAWVYPHSWDNSHENSILTKAGDGEYGVWNLHYKKESSGFRFELDIDDGNPDNITLFESIPSTAVNTWYHVVGTYDGSEMKLYINGTLSNSISVSGAIATNDLPLRIGKQFWWDSYYSYWDGLIDEVKIYDRALGAQEISEHHNDANPSDTVPVDKSYARIPDGSDNWVDPIPTPGTPNQLEPAIFTEHSPQGEIIEEPVIQEDIEIIEEIPEEIILTEDILSETIEDIAEEEVVENIDEIIVELNPDVITEEVEEVIEEQENIEVIEEIPEEIIQIEQETIDIIEPEPIDVIIEELIDNDEITE